MNNFNGIKNKLEQEYHLHDGVIQKFIYDYNTNTIVTIIRNVGWGFPYVRIVFANVLYFNVQKLDFWREDETIYAVEVTSSDGKIEKLYNSISGPKYEDRLSEIKNKNLSKIKIYMFSGNEYEIICENVSVFDK